MEKQMNRKLEEEILKDVLVMANTYKNTKDDEWRLRGDIVATVHEYLQEQGAYGEFRLSMINIFYRESRRD